MVRVEGGQPCSREVGAAFGGIAAVASDAASLLVVEVGFVDRARLPIAGEIVSERVSE